MYLPAHFSEARPAVLRAFVRDHPLGLLVTQNRAGGILNRGASGTILKLINSIIHQNQGTGAGGITNAALNLLQLTDVAVEGNQGGTGGIDNAGGATLTRVSISGNSGTVGGFQNAA